MGKIDSVMSFHIYLITENKKLHLRQTETLKNIQNIRIETGNNKNTNDLNHKTNHKWEKICSLKI